MIGASPKNKDARRLLEGRGHYVDDLHRPGCAYLAVVRSQHAHARIVGVDGAAAAAIPGVLAVWTARELPEAQRPLTSASTGVHAERPFVAPILVSERVRYVGEPVAIVVAETPYVLADALAAVTVDYEPLPPIVGDEAARASSARVHDAWPDNVGVQVNGAVGDVERTLAEPGLTVVRERFRHQRLAAAPIETRGVLAQHDPETGMLTVWGSIQSPYSQRDVIARVLDLPAERVRVVVPDVGGAFGPKGQVYADEILVALAARRLGRPVKWVEGRREDFESVGHDRAQSHHARIAFKADGTIAALDNRPSRSVAQSRQRISGPALSMTAPPASTSDFPHTGHSRGGGKIPARRNTQTSK